LEAEVGNVFNALKKARQESVISRGEDEPAVPAEKVTQQDSVEQVPVEKSAPRERSEPAKKVSRVLEQGSWDERLIKATGVSSSVAESFRTFRTKILHPESGNPIRKVLVTSAVPGEGKSFVCANMAVSFAQGVDHHALMVNCDLRKPSLEKMFGLSNDEGLVNYLRDNAEIGSLITEVGVNKLSLLPAGPPPVNPAELLGSEMMEQLVEELAGRYDDRVVFFDSPPLQVASETAVLAKYVDGIVLVVRWGASRREYVQSLVEQLGKSNIIGIVFNAYKSTIVDNKVFGSYEYQKESYYVEK
jgi:exopolysaccharide/PEP-CTERM locus tyrosine autokinase